MRKAKKWSLKEKRDQFEIDLLMDDQVQANYIAWLEEGCAWAEAERKAWDDFLESEEEFKEDVRRGIRSSGRKIVNSFTAEQPPDFPVTPKEPAHLKVSWLRLD